MSFWSILRQGVPSTVHGTLVIDPTTAEPVVPLTNSQLRAAAMQVEPLGQPANAHQVTVTNLNTNTQLTETCRRISIKARTCDMRYAIGVGAQIANASTSHFIEAGERLDLAIPANAHIAVIRDTAATADGKLCITELA